MRDIYLIDFENVASDGLTGIASLSPEDQVVIFYSSNSNRLTMKTHILIGKSACKLAYFESTVGGRNALDHQIATWLGYLIGTGAATRNYYIVSKDAGYKFITGFWAESEQKPNVYCVDSIRGADRPERSAPEAATPEPELRPQARVEVKKQRQPQNRQKDEPRRVDIAALIAPYPMLQEQHLQQLIADSQKQKLCNHLRKHLGQEKGLALYNEIKRRAWH